MSWGSVPLVDTLRAAPALRGSRAKDWGLSKPRTGKIASVRLAFRENNNVLSEPTMKQGALRIL